MSRSHRKDGPKPVAGDSTPRRNARISEHWSNIQLDSKYHNQSFCNAVEFQHTRSSDMDGSRFVSVDRLPVLHGYRWSRSRVPAIRWLVTRSLISFLSTIVRGPLYSLTCVFRLLIHKSNVFIIKIPCANYEMSFFFLVDQGTVNIQSNPHRPIFVTSRNFPWLSKRRSRGSALVGLEITNCFGRYGDRRFHMSLQQSFYLTYINVWKVDFGFGSNLTSQREATAFASAILDLRMIENGQFAFDALGKRSTMKELKLQTKFITFYSFFS